MEYEEVGREHPNDEANTFDSRKVIVVVVLQAIIGAWLHVLTRDAKESALLEL
jgi:hypothetical protein